MGGAGIALFILGLLIYIAYKSITGVLERRRGVRPAPITTRKIKKMMKQLPKHLRTPSAVVRSTYDLFGGSTIRFSYRPGDPPGKEDPIPTTIRIIIDEKLCLYFYKDDSSALQWVYDGFEAGDYTNDFRDEMVR